MKRLFYLYQRAMWLAGIGDGEFRKPLRFLNEATNIVVALGVYKVTNSIFAALFWIIIVNLTYLILMIILGMIALKMGWVQYNTRLGNSQNPEVLEIRERTARMEMNLNKFIQENGGKLQNSRK